MKNIYILKNNGSPTVKKRGKYPVLLSQGFTLIEVLVGAIILMMILGVLSFTSIQGQAMFKTGSQAIILQSESRSVVNIIAHDLRRTNSAQITITPSNVSTSDDLSFYLPVSYYNTTLNDTIVLVNETTAGILWETESVWVGISGNNTLVKQYKGNTTTLSGNVGEIKYDNSVSPGSIRINLQMQRSEGGRIYNFTTNSTVFLRQI